MTNIPWSWATENEFPELHINSTFARQFRQDIFDTLKTFEPRSVQELCGVIQYRIAMGQPLADIDSDVFRAIEIKMTEAKNGWTSLSLSSEKVREWVKKQLEQIWIRAVASSIMEKISSTLWVILMEELERYKKIVPR